MGYFKGHLYLEKETDASKIFISDDKDSLLYRVPRRIISFIDGCPSKITCIDINYDEDSERLIFCASEIIDEDKQRFTISVQIEKIFKHIEAEGINKNNLVESVFAIRGRQPLITRAISMYLTKNVQIREYDSMMFENAVPGAVNENKKIP